MDTRTNNINLSGEATLGLIMADSGRIEGDFNLNQSSNVNFHCQISNEVSIYQPVVRLRANIGKIGHHNFDPESLQGIIANREAQLAEIREALKKPAVGTRARIAILVGLGGAGKTTLVKLYANDERGHEQAHESFENIIWIDAENPEDVKTTFASILKNDLNVSRAVTGEKQLAEAVYNLLLKYRTLIVFDNVEHVQHIKKFLPTSRATCTPQVIITTRVKAGWQGYKNHLVEIKELDLKTSEDYIRRSLGQSEVKIPDVDEEWENLANYFGRLVIALRAATSSIVEQNERRSLVSRDAYTLKQFLEDVKTKEHLLAREETEIDDLDPAETTYIPLRALWNMNLDSLAQRRFGQLAERVLEILAYLSPSGVPTNWFSILCAKFLDDKGDNLMHAVQLLASWSLVEHLRAEKKYFVHRVLQTTLLIRVKTNSEKRNETLSWFLPAMNKLHLKLHANNNLQHLFPNLLILLDNIKSEICGYVPDAIVSFLTSDNLLVSKDERMKAADEIISNVIRNVSEGLSEVSAGSLNLLLTSSVHKRHLFILLPEWINNYGDHVTLQEQLRFLSDSLEDLDHDDYTFEKRLRFYTAVLKVVRKFEQSVNEDWESITGLHALNLIRVLRDGLSDLMWYDHELIQVFRELKSGLIAAVIAIFRQSMTESRNAGLFYNSIKVVFQWYVALVDFEFARSTESPLHEKCSDLMNDLDTVLVHTGIDFFMVAWYRRQFKRFYKSTSRPPYSSKFFEHQYQTEARFAACIFGIMGTNRSDGLEHGQYLESYNVDLLDMKYLDVPSETSQVLRLTLGLLPFWDCYFEGSIMPAYIMYSGLELRLSLFEQMLISLKETTIQTRAFLRFSPFFDTLKGTSGGSPVLKIFRTVCAYRHPPKKVKRLFPKLEKLYGILKEVLQHYHKSEIESSPCCTSTSSDYDVPDVVERLEELYSSGDHETLDLSQFRAALKQAYADAANSLPPCDCRVSRCQIWLARGQLQEEKTEAAIETALHALEHQLYCPQSFGMHNLIDVLLKAFSKGSNVQVQTEDLLRRLYEGYLDCFGSDDRRTRKSRIKLVRFLCSVGSILEAANFVETQIEAEFDPYRYLLYAGPKFDKFKLLYPTVILMLTLSGDKQRLRRMNARLMQTQEDLAGSSNLCVKERGDYVKYLVTLANTTPHSALSLGFNFSEFRNGARIFLMKSYDDADLASLRRDNPGLRSTLLAWLSDREPNSNQQPSETWCKKHGIDTNQPLNQHLRVLLLFDTMESLLLRKLEDAEVESLLAPLIRQIEFMNTGMDFNVNDSVVDWSIKCLYGMCNRRELWFQRDDFSIAVTQKLTKQEDAKIK